MTPKFLIQADLEELLQDERNDRHSALGSELLATLPVPEEDYPSMIQ